MISHSFLKIKLEHMIEMDRLLVGYKLFRKGVDKQFVLHLHMWLKAKYHSGL